MTSAARRKTGATTRASPLYLRIGAPINRTLTTTTAADGHQLPANARALQRCWDRVIVARALVQALAVTALGVSLIS